MSFGSMNFLNLDLICFIVLKSNMRKGCVLFLENKFEVELRFTDVTIYSEVFIKEFFSTGRVGKVRSW